MFEDHVPPLIEELKVEVPLEQMVCVPLNVPAEVLQGRKANIKPAIKRGCVFGVHVTPALPVDPAVALSAQAAPIAVVEEALFPKSNNSVNELGDDAVHAVKLFVVVEVILEQLPKSSIAELLVTVVMLGIAVSVVVVVVNQEVGAVISNGLAVFTPENAIIAPVVAVEPAVAEKV